MQTRDLFCLFPVSYLISYVVNFSAEIQLEIDIFLWIKSAWFPLPEPGAPIRKIIYLDSFFVTLLYNR